MAQTRKPINVRFPIGGLNRRFAFPDQPPYTTFDAVNVRPVGPLEERVRGGSRPGLMKSFAEQISGASNPVRMIAPLRTLPTAQGRGSWTDDFSSDQAEWSAGGVFSNDWTIGSGKATGSSTVAVVGNVLDAISLDKARGASVFATVRVRSDSKTGYTLYMGLDDTTPNLSTSISCEFTFDPSIRQMALTLKRDGTTMKGRSMSTAGRVDEDSDVQVGIIIHDNGIVEAGVFGTPLSGYFSLASYVLAGTRVALQMETFAATLPPWADGFSYSYLAAATSGYPPHMMLAVANGALWKETTAGAMAAVGGSPPALASDRTIHAAQRRGKLYIADYELLVEQTNSDGSITAGLLDDDDIADWTALGIQTDEAIVEVTSTTSGNNTGVYKISVIHATNGLTLVGGGAITETNVNFRVIRAPKIYDPTLTTGNLYIWWPTTGSIPPGCPIVVVYRDRLVLAGDINNPGIWYMSRHGDPLDFDYLATVIGAARAGTSTDSDTGGLPKAITALCPMGDDYLLMACDNELWVLRGDPTQGGLLDNVSYTIGIIGQGAWCRTPDDEIVFLGKEGLYKLRSGAIGDPEPLSRDRIPIELKGLDAAIHDVTLVYDTVSYGVHIFVSGVEGPGTKHFWFDWPTQSFWRVTLQSDHEPMSACYADRRGVVMLGCRDGYIRQFGSGQQTDDGSTIENYVFYGPFRLGRKDTDHGGVQAIQAVLAEGSGDVDWSIHVDETAELASEAASFASGTWSAGRNYMNRPRAGGRAAYLRVANNSTTAWTIESIEMELAHFGKAKQQ